MSGPPPPTRRVLLLWAALACVAALVAPAVTRADGDPASDVLALGMVFEPYAPAVSPSLHHQLANAAQASVDAGYPIRVALIASRNDLGSVPSLFRRPRQYAQFLGEELHFAYKGVLLVVMPNGFGVHGPLKKARAYRLLGGVPIDRSARSDGLARAALAGMRKLAAAAGHPLRPSAAASARTTGGGGGGAASSLRIALAVAGLVVAAFGVAAIWTLRRPGRRFARRG